jgi:hypothetical protein
MSIRSLLLNRHATLFGVTPQNMKIPLPHPPPLRGEGWAGVSIFVLIPMPRLLGYGTTNHENRVGRLQNLFLVLNRHALGGTTRNEKGFK